MQMPEVGPGGQRKLSEAKVLLVGLGGLGSPAALYLAAAGVGTLGLIDFDRVDETNLQRQVIYFSQDSGKPKALAAKERLLQLNPEIKIEAFDEKLTLHNALSLFAKFDYIVDGADNFATRFLVNDASYFSGKPLVSASVLAFEGQLCVFNLKKGPCYRCLFAEPPPAGSVPSCTEIGVLGTMPGMMGVMQANEVLKLILGLNEQSSGKMFLWNGLANEMTSLDIQKNPECALCGKNKTITELKEQNFVCSLDQDIPQITEAELIEGLQKKNFQILDVREASELAQGKLNFNFHIPLGNLEKEYSQISQETPLLIYCQSGIRSLKACELLKSKGYHVLNLQGGFKSLSKN